MAILAGQRIRALDFAGYANAIDGTNITGITAAANDWTTPSPVFGVSFMAPSSGAVRCDFGGRIDASAAGTIVYAACQLRTGDVINSGVIVDDVSLEQSIESGGGRLGATNFRIHTGLTPGALYNFVWLCGRSNTTATISVYARTITVSPWQG